MIDDATIDRLTNALLTAFKSYEESRHPRASDGRFGSVPGAHHGGAVAIPAHIALALSIGRGAADLHEVFSKIGTASKETLVKLGAAAAHLEHAAIAWTKDKLVAGLAKLPPATRAVVVGMLRVGRVLTKVAFAGWTATQALAERVAQERGRSPEEARRFRGVLSTADLATFKPIILTGLLGVAGEATWVIPPVTGAYLAYSTATNPLATARAAYGLVKDAVKRRRKSDDGFDAYALDDRLAAHKYDDWYIALLSTAADLTGSFRDAADVADEVFAKHPSEHQ